MSDGLSMLEPDVVCLQEAFLCPEKDTDTASFLAKHLGMDIHVLIAREKPRRFEGDPSPSWSNLAILSKQPAERHHDVKLAEHSKDDDRWVMQVLLKLNRFDLRVINTHFTHLRDEVGVRTRRAQARQLVQLCQYEDADGVILCGDLNAEWESDDLAPLRALEWQNVETDAVGSTWLGEAEGRVARPARRIDHVVFLAPMSRPIRMTHRFSALNEVVGPSGEYPSDHAAVVADLHLGSHDLRGCA